MTYEGLKPSKRAALSFRFLGFGVTYEGLKRASQSASSNASMGFGVTYEGLKHTMRRFLLPLLLLVLELPMRV